MPYSIAKQHSELGEQCHTDLIMGQSSYLGADVSWFQESRIGCILTNISLCLSLLPNTCTSNVLGPIIEVWGDSGLHINNKQLQYSSKASDQHAQTYWDSACQKNMIYGFAKLRSIHYCIFSQFPFSFPFIFTSLTVQLIPI